jgi:hypothetical protein
MSNELFAALFATLEQDQGVKFYVFLDQHNDVVATGTATNLEHTTQFEIDEAGHKLCLDKGTDLVYYKDGHVLVKEVELEKSKQLVYIDNHFDLAAVDIKIKGSSASAKLTKKGLVELENYASKGKVSTKIWILDADFKHRCVAELKIGTDFIMDSVKLEYIPTRMIAATYPVFSSYTFDTE